jgi:hypothetical protein
MYGNFKRNKLCVGLREEKPMTQQHEATTERLVGIIADIKIKRKSGQLTVRRGEGLTSEEGTLVFVRGQMTQASVGRRNGSEALNWLSTWQQARYIFISTSSEAEVSTEFAPLPSSSFGTTTNNPSRHLEQIDTDRLEAAQPLAYGVPHVTVDLDEATTRLEQAGLPRAYRRLYLLIDGHRSAIELVPLSGKKAEEVRNMLYDLEWLGIIRIVNPSA